MSERTRSRRPRPAPPPRDQEASTFTKILERLVRALPGAKGTALVDAEGETVDYFGILDPFDLKVAAAHWQIVLGELRETPNFASPKKITVRARGRGYIVRQLPDGYALVVVFHPLAAFAASERTLEEIEAQIYAEAGWARPQGSTKWFRVDVETAPPDHSRPRRLRAAGGWQPIEVMGAMVGLRGREKGFRVRLPSGAEMLLVRECRDRWFADEHVEELI
ncbi:hypothetical protein [Polyangium jinanense]|uniref:Roadblock/LAMTOR2 domain-containing protein n=1 Tax=Polyangium jinanense TaxID=2829994 RepID=A0A9X3XBZ9_9BACT|nr:hypothetical protein [Polyangium jinanense]MDC3955980.1 hypothetical protein [Polyangium jinanense]MDC3985081.1 hypothetical protein [Polyangium jinanense]